MSDRLIQVEESAAQSNEYSWLDTWRRYLSASLLGHFAWELAHLPLYSVWTEGSWGERLFAAAHAPWAMS